MNLEQIANKTLIDSGQFTIGTLSDLDLDLKSFWVIVKDTLRRYNKYRMREATVNVVTSAYQFTAPFPIMVSAVVPNLTPAISARLPDLQGKVEVVPWSYDPVTGKLAIGSPVVGFEVTAHYKYEFVETLDANNVLVQVDIPLITEEDYLFFDLLLGKFLLAIGRSRRAFTLSEIPIISDAESLVSEGKDLVDDTMVNLMDEGDWAFGAQL